MKELTPTIRGMKAIADAVQPMRHNRLGNYIVPGLTSHLIGGGEYGKVRLFHAERNTRDIITPHSHRFDFTCLVLAGSVRNTIYRESVSGDEMWCLSTIDQVCGLNGLLDFVHQRETSPSRYTREIAEYGTGDTYSMTYDEIHSIEFARETQVLFFEAPQKVTRSCMIEPWVNGKVVPTFRTEDWMFEHDSPVSEEVPHG